MAGNFDFNKFMWPQWPYIYFGPGGEINSSRLTIVVDSKQPYEPLERFEQAFDRKRFDRYDGLD